MENPAFELVRQILRSPQFLTQTAEQQQATIDQVLETGEVSREEVLNLLNEVVTQQSQQVQKLETEDEKLKRLLNSVDYNTFLTIILDGNITGQRLITLCSTSRKLNEYCNRSFQLLNKEGNLVGTPQDQYLFRLLLNKRGISVPIRKTPKQIYIELLVGGKVLAFGSNHQGQLGLGDTEDKNVPTVIPNFNDIVQVSTGSNHSLCLDSHGRVWSFGKNYNGQLGLGDDQNRNIPALIPTLNNIIQVCAGESHSLCLDSDGHVWSFGWNGGGQLGLGINSNKYFPTLIPNLENIIQISTKINHSLCLDNQGRVWSFGRNYEGQLGLGYNQDNANVPILIPNIYNIVQVSAGDNYSLCLDNQGRVFVFGFNKLGQLGLGDYYSRYIPTLNLNLNNIIQISAGGVHSLCLDGQGRVWVFGDGGRGQLGLGDGSQGTGGNFSGRNIPVLNPYLSNIIKVSAGLHSSFCLDNQRRVWVFGNNQYGQLGLGALGVENGENRNVPVSNPYLSDVIGMSIGYHSLCIIGSWD